MVFCKNCGIQLVTDEKLCLQCGCPNNGLSSTLNISIVSLLCFFFGFLGVHRFYMGKTISAVIMLLTLGGCGIWTLIDLVWVLSGKFRDKYDLPINTGGNLGNLVYIIIAVILVFYVFVFGITASLVYSNYYSKIKNFQGDLYQQLNEQDYEMRLSYASSDVVLAEYDYFDDNGTYTTNYDALVNKYELVLDDEINYGSIDIYTTQTDGEDNLCFSFTIYMKNSVDDSIFFDSCGYGY
jgi:TM2 domain-containing membrane protein YozV